MSKIFKLDEFGYSVEIGKVAGQADGAAWFRQGDTLLLATVVSNPSKEFPGFLPLMIDYREPFSAAGKIPGGYYKREGKSTDKEVLTSRLIDRAIRPLFPETYFHNLQVIVTVYSVDKNFTPGKLALLASSIALTVSKVPFLGPVGSVEVSKVDGKWIFDPSYDQTTVGSDARVVFAGTEEGICMVEGHLNQISESEFLDIMFQSHDRIKKQVEWQKQIKKELAVVEESYDDGIDWVSWRARVDSFLTLDRVDSMYISDKIARGKNQKSLKEEFNKQYSKEIEESKTHDSVIDYVLDMILKEKLTDRVIDKKSRVDGRAFDEVRKIATEVGLLPTTHGSALFNRGKTQALVSVTLGGGQDEQKIEGIMDEPKGSAFMLNYNFPPFSVGECRPMRGPGRREVGHGHLAASSFTYVLPSKEDFPYTIRIVADMLESDGSTSMATTCGSTMALMDTGVPLKKMVGGVAMGLLRRYSDGAWAVLTDISGFEDAFGLMDFKVTGTDKGICAIQMDIKSKAGFSKEVFESALDQAKKGRLYILGEMQKVMSQSNTELSPLVPKVVTITVPTDKIGAIIGTGGKVIREITEKTGTTIDIDGNDGKVRIYGGPSADLDRAIAWVKVLGGNIESGSRYMGIIRRIADFGLFVELVPGCDGLVHVSNIPREKQRAFMNEYKIDQNVLVEVISYEADTGRIRLKLIEENK
ncbi:MAG: Polyribonucleotide nucleotidyltransferase [candidate division TM6 bacterium GW2011_GWF2_30_66]|jgi:polyribonucleotide nucleotidyltransferase|nr:MAG: Polyribonucleotide nucleotidyltransferase [candidate division TM6 bacterium GW2011_GWF2_30_66]